MVRVDSSELLEVLLGHLDEVFLVERMPLTMSSLATSSPVSASTLAYLMR
jgi:hypothetical protein